jgi:hypothetical protein
LRGIGRLIHRNKPWVKEPFPAGNGMTDGRCLTNVPTLRPNPATCANMDRGRPSASYSKQRLGCGYGASAASITHRWRAQSPSSCGGRMLQATNCVPAHAVLIAGKKVRPSSARAGPAIISVFIRFRLKSNPPCKRQRAFPNSTLIRQGRPARVLAPQRGRSLRRGRRLRYEITAA